MRSNFKNTITDIKRFIGLPYSSAFVQRELQFLPFNTRQLPGDRVGIEVRPALRAALRRRTVARGPAVRRNPLAPVLACH